MRSSALQLCANLASSARYYAKSAGVSPGKRLGLAEVQHVVAVASGKGGVGKSTVAGVGNTGVCTRFALTFRSVVTQAQLASSALLRPLPTLLCPV